MAAFQHEPGWRKLEQRAADAGHCWFWASEVAVFERFYPSEIVFFELWEMVVVPRNIRDFNLENWALFMVNRQQPTHKGEQK